MKSQAESILATLAGKNVIVATMTSSGKSLCYNIPVLEVLLHNPLACALYLFPTKVCFLGSKIIVFFSWLWIGYFIRIWLNWIMTEAKIMHPELSLVLVWRYIIDSSFLQALAQDQLRALLTLSHGLDDSINIGIYDGDTCHEDRLWLRDNARLVFPKVWFLWEYPCPKITTIFILKYITNNLQLITNPDMLHISILPFHGQFRRILSNLRYFSCLMCISWSYLLSLSLIWKL